MAAICWTGEKPKTYAEAVANTKALETVVRVWKCAGVSCNQWMLSEKSVRCTACNLPRIKEAREATESGGKELMKMPKATAEAVERLNTEEEDELMEYPLPEAEQELQAERERLKGI